MEALHGSVVFVSRKWWAQESVQWYLHNRKTCWLEARKDTRRGGYALFCCGEHYGFIGHILMWELCRSSIVEIIGFKFCPDNGELFERLIILPKDDLREFFRESV